jgi:hypothetical protein
MACTPRSREGAHTGLCEIRHFSTVELALEVGVGESGASASTWLPRVFSRAKIRAHSPGSYPDRFDYFGQGEPRHQSDVGNWDADVSTAAGFMARLAPIRGSQSVYRRYAMGW